MSTVKNLLRKTHDAYRGSHKSVPDMSREILTTITVNTATEEAAFYYAPTDGVVCAQGNHTSTYFAMSVNDKVFFAAPSNGTWSSGSAPVKKGSKVGVWAGGAPDGTMAVKILFYPYIGAQ